MQRQEQCKDKKKEINPNNDTQKTNASDNSKMF